MKNSISGLFFAKEVKPRPDDVNINIFKYVSENNKV
jgi:hypothetical protein